MLYNDVSVEISPYIPPQQIGLPPPSSQQQTGIPVGQGQPPPTGTGDGWRTPEKRQLVIRKMYV